MNRQDMTAAALAAAEDAERHQELVRSVVRTARAVFGAAACSVLGHQPAAGRLVFEAVSGAGEEFLAGSGFPAGRGIAGWVLFSGEPMVVDDLTGSQVFDREIARATGYVPNALMAAPLLDGDEVIGVMEVLDRSTPQRASIQDLDLLGLFAAQAAGALALARRARRTAAALTGAGVGGSPGGSVEGGPLPADGVDAELAEVALLAEVFSALPEGRRASGRALLRALTDSLGAPRLDV